MKSREGERKLGHSSGWLVGLLRVVHPSSGVVVAPVVEREILSATVDRIVSCRTAPDRTVLNNTKALPYGTGPYGTVPYGTVRYGTLPYMP